MQNGQNPLILVNPEGFRESSGTPSGYFTAFGILQHFTAFGFGRIHPLLLRLKYFWVDT